MRRLWRAAFATASLVLVACGDADTAAPVLPPTRPEAQLTFLRPATGAVLSADSVSFWAVKGDDREVSLYFRPRAGSTDSTRFLQFKVDDESLWRRPDGTAFAPGDSIRITIRILDFSRLITRFEPSGLRFSADDPAELRLDFRNADGDYDDDGDDDVEDDQRVPSFAIWKQERLGLPWTKLTSAVEVSGNLSEVKADITSFTNHAIAF